MQLLWLNFYDKNFLESNSYDNNFNFWVLDNSWPEVPRYSYQGYPIIDYRKKKWVLYCPYCGSNQLQTIKKKSWSYTRSFDIDHFIPKSKYPKYTHFLFNLIPVCQFCNRNLKSTKEFTNLEETYIFHPLLGWMRRNKNRSELSKVKQSSFHDLYEFKWNQRTWEIKIERRENKLTRSISTIERKKFNNHIKFFLLSGIYNWWSPLITHDLQYAHKTYQNYKESLGRGIPRRDKILDNWYPVNESELLSYPNWKFRLDLVKFIENELLI
jgi:uncharacterized protein YeeX (DUF496 family)